ncbi:hypothetical protein [Microbacterium pumilum]
MRRSAKRKRILADRRRRANESSKRWKQAHPEHVTDYRRRWVEANPEKVREYYKRYHATHREVEKQRATAWRDANPEKMKNARKAWADRNKDRLAANQRARRKDPVRYRADLDANSAANRLRRRLERAGLPPRQLHRTMAAERRANDRAADDYFGQADLPERLRQFTVLTVSLTEELLEHGDRLLDFAKAYAAMRVRVGLPPVDAEQIMYARAAQAVTDRMKRIDRLTSREVRAAVRSARSVFSTATRQRRMAELVRDAESHIRKNGARLEAEAAIENSARALRGKVSLPTELLIARIAMQDLPPAERELETARAAEIEVASRLRRSRDTSLTDPRQWMRASQGPGFRPVGGSLAR